MEEKTRKTKLQERFNDLIQTLIHQQNFSEQQLYNLNLNFSFIEKDATKLFTEYSESYYDDKFDFTAKIPFELNVSYVINVETKLRSFKGKHKNKFSTFNECITDSNFKTITDVLDPGKRRAMFLPVKNPMTFNYCENFLKAQNCILAGPQAVSLVWTMYKFLFKKPGRYFCLSEKDALWRDGNHISRIPFVEKNSLGEWIWDVEDAAEGFAEGDWILCIFPN